MDNPGPVAQAFKAARIPVAPAKQAFKLLVGHCSRVFFSLKRGQPKDGEKRLCQDAITGQRSHRRRQTQGKVLTYCYNSIWGKTEKQDQLTSLIVIII